LNLDRSRQKWEQFTDKEWKQILLQLRKHAQAKCTILPADVEPDDIASEALTRVLEGFRNWNQEKHPDLLHLLKSTVDSILSKIWKLKENKYRLRESVEYTNISALENYESSETENKEMREDFENRLDEIRSYVEGDNELEELFLAIEYGHFSRSEISEFLQWETRKFDNAKRRLKRLIEKNNKKEKGEDQ
jgi:DNA-directed RNA polymerase specialized sigma24 family protein